MFFVHGPRVGQLTARLSPLVGKTSFAFFAVFAFGLTDCGATRSVPQDQTIRNETGAILISWSSIATDPIPLAHLPPASWITYPVTVSLLSTCVTWCSHRPSCLPTLVSRALHVHISYPISQLHVCVTRNPGCQEGDISVWLHLRVI